MISWQDFGAALTGLGSILGVIIVLPSKIAEHLFPSGGSKDSMGFVKSMQEYDLEKQPQEDVSPCDYLVEVDNVHVPAEDRKKATDLDQ